MNYRLRLEMLEDRCVPTTLGGMMLGHEAASFPTAHPAAHALNQLDRGGRARAPGVRRVAERVPGACRFGIPRALRAQEVASTSPSASQVHAASALPQGIRAQEVASTSLIAPANRMPQVHAMSPSASQAHAARRYPGLRAQETTSVHATSQNSISGSYGSCGTSYAYQAYLYAPSGSYAETYAYDAYCYGSLGYYSSATSYAYQAYLYAPSGSYAETYAYDAYCNLYYASYYASIGL